MKSRVRASHKHKWKKIAQLDGTTEIVECESCPARIARLTLGRAKHG